MSRALEICGTITKVLTFLPCCPRPQEKEYEAKKEFKQIMAENLPNLVRDINLQLKS